LLISNGPQSLRLADVAKEASVVHATILHHFGSIHGVHTALMERMIEDLVERILALQMPEGAEIPRGFAFNLLIEAFNDKGAARLAAWLELTDESRRLTSVREAVNTVIREKIRPEGVPLDRLEDIILLSITMALGIGLFGPSLEAMLDRPDGRTREMALELFHSGLETLSNPNGKS
tara:strand:+ start:23321 stop:23851 length:531 start_codon:yes stop_codon:yes gene_type:complete